MDHPTEQAKSAKKYRSWLSKIETREEAQVMVRECAIALFFLAALQAVFALIQGPLLLASAAAWAIGGLWLLRTASRAAATLLLLSALTYSVIALANQAGAALGGGSNVMLAIVVVWTAIKAVEATFRLRGRFTLSAGGNANK